MLLAIDVGNTQTHLGVFARDELSHEWRITTEQRRTADEFALMLGQFLSQADLSFSRQVTGVAICSVVPRATQELRAMTEGYFGFSPVVVQPGIRTGIVVKIDNPREVGADRISNAVAAHHMFPGQSLVVVDFGTAVTVDAISSEGEFLGGAIAPGVDISATALYESAAQIRRVELVAPSFAIGKNTVNAVQSGLVYGTAALVDGLVARATDELGGDARVIATGGLAPAVVDHCASIEKTEPQLTLIGLRLIFDRNVGAAE